MDREEKLRVAKEKLKQFQKKRLQKDISSSNGDDSSSEPRASPFTAPSPSLQVEISSHQQDSGEFPVFRMANSSSVVAEFLDEVSQPEQFSSSLVDSAFTSVKSFNGNVDKGFEKDVDSSLHNYFASVSQSTNVENFAHSSVSNTSSNVDHSKSVVSSGSTTQLTTPLSNVDILECVDAMTAVGGESASEIETLCRDKEDLEKKLRVQAASLKQYDTYCQSLASELTTCQATLEKERKEHQLSLESESCSLRSQLQSHTESIKILVAEKSDFEASIRKLNLELASKTAELQRLRDASNVEAVASRQEAERAQIRAELEASVMKELQRVQGELRESLQANEDLKQEVAELQSKIKTKDKAHDAMKAEVASKSSKLEMAELNLAQLRAVKDADEVNRDEAEKLAEKEREVARLTAENAEHIQRVSELTAYIQQASVDREQIIHQYTSYSQQLAAQIESLTCQLNETAQEKHQLATREKELVAHVESLEEQLQSLLQREPSPGPKDKAGSHVAEEINILRRRVADLDQKVLELQVDRDQLQEEVLSKSSFAKEVTDALADKTEQVKELETQLDMLKSSGTVDISHMDLMAACESDKVAASRAMSQNKQLKDQLEELQMAIVEVTNSKAELVNELDSLKTSHAKHEKEESALKMEIEGLHEALAERDRNLNHMRDQVKYYIAFAENSITGHLDSGPRRLPDDHTKELITKLQSAQEEVRSLNSQNAELRSQIEVLSSRTRDNSETPMLHSDDSTQTTPPRSEQTNSMSGSPRPPPSPTPSTGSATSSGAASSLSVSPTPNIVMPSPLESSRDDSQGREKSETTGVESLPRKLDPVPPMSHEVALLKLEQKFKQAMARIAELTNEKEQLEHVIVQLQEETETVGEYITIYQYQRRQQRQRLEEKERQLQLVSREREDLKTKLSQLQTLVTSFVQDGSSKQPGSQYHNGQVEVGEDALESEEKPAHLEQVEVSKVVEETASPSSDAQTANVETTEPHAPVTLESAGPARQQIKDNPPSPSKADKILALISEIGANQMLNNMDDFQPWFWEQSPGKLINI